MRITFPLRISLTKALIALVVLFCVQQMEGTGIIFSLLFFAFVFLGVLAFNHAGGFSRASGAYIFLYILLTAGIGVLWKTVLGEPADGNLRVPLLMMSAYAVSAAVLLLVVLVNRRLTANLTSFSSWVGMEELNYSLAGMGCLAAALVITAANTLIGATPGGLLSILNQLNQFAPVAIILGTIGAMVDSGGRRGLNLVNLLALGLVLVQGTLTFSKQGMLTPLACWVVAACYMRFRLRVVHLLVLAICLLLTFTVVPLLAMGRNSVPTTGANYEQRAYIAIDILTHLQRTRETEQEAEDLAALTAPQLAYFNKPQGFLERLTMIPPDDAFFNYSEEGHRIGYVPVLEDFENLIPHFILPNKPLPISGNHYAHLIGGFLSADDFSTGISFSPIAEAYQIDGWTSVCLMMPVLWLLLFFLTDAVCGDLRDSPWGLLAVVTFAHQAAESLVSGLIYMTFYDNLALLVAILFAARVAPVIGYLFYGRQLPQSGRSARVAAQQA